MLLVQRAETGTEVPGPAQSLRYLPRVEGVRTVAMPEGIGTDKASAEAFAEAWRHRVGPAHLVFTQTPPGRRALATARARSLGQEEGGERVHRWWG